MIRKDKICKIIEEKKDLFIEVSDKVWEYAELGLKEYKSADVICNALEEEDFTVKKGLAGMETAFVGSYGEGKPIIAILGEYDALPGLSQKKASYVKEEVIKGGSGHGCGHNLLGAGSLAAVVAVKDYLKEAGIEGTIRYYGCPGEENGSGKTFMTREGCFDDVDIAFCWHPGDRNSVWGMGTLATFSIYFKFKGKSAHAAATPHLGRSALDAVELMNVGANFLREHIIPEARLHYSITNPGSSAPNVVQDEAEVYYYIRAPKVYQVQEVYDRLSDVAKGAALMTGTKCEIVFREGMSDYIPNKVLGQVLHENLVKAGAPNFEEEDLELANKFRETLNESDIKNTLMQVNLMQGPEVAKNMNSKILSDFIGSYIHIEKAMPGSTDVGDVSYVVPTGQIGTACNVLGTAPHTWQFAAQAASSIGHKGMLTAGKAMGMAAVDVLHNPKIVKDAKEELKQKTNGEYICPIPKHVKPGVQ